ncbi:MAG: phosphatidylglycerophosphatase A [Pelistega sp.]|nr:phosphatidylglycerophosphatase A [Pelistega sp.]
MNSAEPNAPSNNNALEHTTSESPAPTMTGSDQATLDTLVDAHVASTMTNLGGSGDATPEKAAQTMSSTGPVTPTFVWVKQSVHRLFAFGFGSGLIKPAPGTWGTLMAWALWLPLSSLISHDIWMAVFLFLMYVYGVFICQKVTQDMGVADHGGVVWDEIVAFWLVLFVITPLPLIWQAVAFGVFRFFDIIKPWPIAFFDERLKNGFGVMWDDIIAALYSLFVIAVLLRIVGG